MYNTETNSLEARIEKVSELDLFFIAGMPRSGTTWTQRILDAHPQICCKGESHFVNILYSNLHKAITAYNKEVKQQGGAIAHLKKYGGHVDSLDYQTQDMQLILYYAIGLMLGKWLDSDEIKTVGEKTPDNLMSINFLGNLFPHSKFVHIIRDPRDCAVSAWLFNLANVDKNKVITDTFDSFVIRYLKQWNAGIQFATAIGITLDSRYHTVKYEDLIKHPHDSADRLFQFINVDSPERTISQCLDKESFTFLSGGRKPGQEDQSSFFRKGICGDWKNYFSANLSNRALDIVGEKMNALGYI